MRVLLRNRLKRICRLLLVLWMVALWTAAFPAIATGQNVTVQVESEAAMTTTAADKDEDTCGIEGQRIVVEETELFCIKTWLAKGETISERKSRIESAVEKVFEGEIFLESLGIIEIRDIDKRFTDSKPFVNLYGDADNDDRSVAVISDQENLPAKERLMFYVSEADTALASAGK